jgi:hypothetical protein
MLRSTLGTVAIACLLAVPATATASTRYVGNPGTGGAPCTDEQHPCVLFTALNEAVAGDTISIRRDPAPYNLPSELTIDKRLIIVGAPGPRPVFEFTANSGDGFVFDAGSAGSELRHLRIEAPNGATAVYAPERAALSDLDIATKLRCALFSAPNSSLTDSTLTETVPGSSSNCLAVTSSATGFTARGLTVSRSGGGGEAVSFDAAGLDATDLTVTADRVGIDVEGGTGAGDAPAILRRARVTTNATIALHIERKEGGGPLVVSDVVARAKAPGGYAIESRGGPALRNLTAVASGPGSYGLQVRAQFSSTPAPVVVRSSVFRADGADIWIEPSSVATFATPVEVSHSNFRTVDGTLAAGSGSNQSGDPLFADAAGGDFHPLTGSPLIDAGTSDSASGPSDLDGRARTLGAAPDIGAYEFPPPPPPPPPGVDPGAPGGPAGPAGPGTGVTADLAAPELTSLALTNRTFAVGSAETPVAARAKKGTTFRLTLSEAATVAVAFERSEPGRRKARRCVKPTSRNRKARKCERWVKRGAIQRTVSAGPVAIPFSGRIGRKALKTGSYRALVAARDAAGNVSKQRTVAFKIVKR